MVTVAFVSYPLSFFASDSEVTSYLFFGEDKVVASSLARAARFIYMTEVCMGHLYDII